MAKSLLCELVAVSILILSASFCWQENLNNNEFEENAKISRSRQSCKTTFVVDNFETAKNAHKVAEADECFMKDAVLLKTPQTKVQEEIKQRCSSTPYHRDPDTGIKDYDEGAGKIVNCFLTVYDVIVLPVGP